MRPPRRAAATLVLLLGLIGLSVPFASAQDGSFSERNEGQHVLDDGRVIDDEVERSISEDLAELLATTGVDIVVYTREKQRVGARKGAREDAAALLAAWAVGGEADMGAAMLWNLAPSRDDVKPGVAITGGLADLVDADDLDQRVFAAIQPSLSTQEWDLAATDGVVALTRGVVPEAAVPVTPAPSAVATERTPRPTRAPGTPGRPSLGPVPPAGPPYPDPNDGVRVYDYAEVLDDTTVEALSGTIADIEERTGAQVVVYSQVKPASDTPAEAEADAVALIDQWGIGRAGFDDGLVILFDLTEDRCHGQVQLYAAPGYAAAYLTNQQRQAIFEDDMLPFLRQCDFDSAMLAAFERIDETATAEHARDLQLARQVDAAAGLVLAPLLLVGLVGWAGWSWLRYGRDPEYLDDPSILMPAPPPGMSPAAAAVIMEGRSRRRALTTALVDLAARGEIGFRQSEQDDDEVDIDITVPDQRDARLARNRRLPLGPAEAYALAQLKELGGSRRTIEADDVPGFSKAVDGFDERLEALVAEKGWYREPPEDSITRWSLRAGIALVVGVVATFLGINLPSSGALLVGIALVVAAVAMFILSRVMPQRTMEGARMYAQLAAYRRTLQKTLESARTMDQVVASSALPWVETPDQAVVWAYALGLHEEAEEVLERSLEDVRAGGASPTRTYFPLWFTIGPRTGARTSSAAKAPTAGLFSGGVVPNFTAMTAALGSIGSPPPSSGGGGGGGFGGGSSGGGGGGAGGGF